jgi:hypothetical protein
MIDGALLRAIRHDLLCRPADAAMGADLPGDVFAPNTLAAVLGRVGPEVAAAACRAVEAGRWGPEIARAVCDALEDAAMEAEPQAEFAAGLAAALARRAAAETGAAGGRKRAAAVAALPEHFSPLQSAVRRALQALSPDADASEIARHLFTTGEYTGDVRDVRKALKKVMAKGARGQ